ncbi:hypothetical protein P6U16_21105 [Rhizobium sp. 32-5/1]|uniref:hypothetical protein n=1 Tax=Rhizobium sp. 32-5/1 TaxID=3019602 RepID=UPI00240E4F2E|nr:hypothetical protein [Rhizobium sp. 32-5/1]WEZ83295.1 hypothetical protein P6U16_21105 [Rhizobium sp. 32-5/1]
MANPIFLPTLQQGARHLIELYDRFPRVARLVAAQQKWLLTHAAFALHLERDPANPLSGITAARLLEIIVEFGAASRNTATAFLAEMQAYKFIRDVPGFTNRRSRPLEPTEVSHEAMYLWFRGQMRSLDLLDGGERVRTLESHPQIFNHAQPRAAKQLIADPAWREPPLSIATFVWTESGGLILDDLMARVVNLNSENGLHWVEQLRFAELSKHFSISRTHVRRLFARVEALDLIGWEDRTVSARLWIKPLLIDDYARWQAVKFSALDKAYRDALETLNCAGPLQSFTPPVNMPRSDRSG